MTRCAAFSSLLLCLLQVNCHSDERARGLGSPAQATTTPAIPMAAPSVPAPTPESHRTTRDSSSSAIRSGDSPEAAQELSSDSPTTQLPAGLQVGIPHEHALPGDRSLRITHAPATERRALVYLHGMCGNSKGADPWAHVSKDYGTLIVVRATVPCEDRPGFKWPQEVESIQARIERALRETQRLREGQLDTERVVLFGYSQGSNRAEKLAGLHPERYPWVVLGGTPTVAVPERLLATEGVAFLGGELEDISHMIEGMERVRAAGRRARFFLLPGVHHGSYGPEGPAVVRSALEYLFQPQTP